MANILSIQDAKPSIKRRHLTWDDQSKFYRYPNGRKVSDRAIYLLINRETNDLKSNQGWAINQLLNNTMSFEEFQKFNINQLREYHVNMMRLGKGGTERTSANDYLEVARELRANQYPWFERLMRQIKNGELSENQIRDRLSRYANNTKISYEQGRINAKASIEPWGRRLLGRSCKNHCSDCLYYASLGWMPLFQVVIPGRKCACRDKCCCSVETSKQQPINLSDSLPFAV